MGPGSIFLVRRYRIEAIPLGGSAYSQTIFETANCFRRDFYNTVDMMVEAAKSEEFRDHEFIMYRVVEEIVGHSGDLDKLMGEVNGIRSNADGLRSSSDVSESSETSKT
jgi:hypothetical protein